jgi:nucleotide-binding universal stress UspA family protein
MTMQPIHVILHPTDLSIPSQLALELACVLARTEGARLILLHVVPNPPRINGSENAAVLRELESGRLELYSYREEMRQRLAKLPVPGLPAHVERQLAEGDVATTVLRKASESGCDLIVMGTHGRTGAARRLMGSVAEKVVRDASCPVVIVKTPLAVRELTLELTNEEMAVIL